MSQISGFDIKIFRCASNEIEALIDLWLKGVEDFKYYYSSIPDEMLSREIDKDGETPLSVAKHVLACALGHVIWSIELAGLTPPDREIHKSIKSIENKKDIMDMADKLINIIPPALSPMTNDHLSCQGTTSWGEHMSSEGMIEHTILHIYRHIRQLKVRLHNA